MREESSSDRSCWGVGCGVEVPGRREGGELFGGRAEEEER